MPNLKEIRLRLRDPHILRLSAQPSEMWGRRTPRSTIALRSRRKPLSIPASKAVIHNAWTSA